jgi:L-serine dehydratase
MCGIESKIPFHEVVDTMQETGRKMDFTLRETSKGGLAMTPTGIKIMKKIKKI